MRKNLICLLATAIAPMVSHAGIHCVGTVAGVYKWDTFTTLSVEVKLPDGTVTNWISLPSKSDEALVLTAYAMGKTLDVYWDVTDISGCANGWPHNRKLTGFIFMQ